MAQNRPSFEPIGETVDGYLFIDRSSVKIQGKLTKAWTLFSSKDVYVDMYGKKSSSAMTNTIYNCKDDTYAMKQSVQYAGDTGTGVVVSSLLIPDSKLEFVDPVPGSTGAIELARACSLGSKK